MIKGDPKSSYFIDLSLCVLLAILIWSCSQPRAEYSQPDSVAAYADSVAYATDTLAFADSSVAYDLEKIESADEIKIMEEKQTFQSTDQYYKVPLVYGTDRKPERDSKGLVFYGTKRRPDNNFDVGTIEITIPKTHKVGQVEKHHWWQITERKNDPSQYFTSLPLMVNYDSGIALLRKLVSRSNENDAFIFVHGFNNTFEEAAYRTAQVAFDMGFSGCPVFFSWPSNGKTLDYVSDYENIQWSIPHLKAFILDVINKGKAKKLHIVAHSMGNKGLAEVLKTLQSENRGVLFNQIILAAPDIDADIFKNQIAPNILKVANRITLYASSKDKALIASKTLRKDYKRAGETDEGVLTIDGIQTIDASGIVIPKLLTLNHSYFVESPVVINDMSTLFRNNLPPERRNLEERSIKNARYWAFKQ